jgi:hypothetical protein
MNNKIIRISTESELTIHDFPKKDDGDYLNVLYELIGNDCECFEHVKPRRLYKELNIPKTPTVIAGQCVSMLVDERGLFKQGIKPNIIASYLYESDKHQSPIVGNVIFVGECYTDDGIDFCGIDDNTVSMLEKKFNNMISIVRNIRR